jgi:hypothetical protein
MGPRGLPLAALALVIRLCGGEDPVAVLEKQKQELLANTVEKREFWTQVERKGVFAKEKRALEEEAATLSGDVAVAESRRAAVEPALAQARDVNARAEAVKVEIEKRDAELAAAIRELEATLAAWKRAEGSG